MRRVVVAALLAAACGHGTAGRKGSTRGAIAVTNEVAIVFDDPVRTVPFDTRDVRLQRGSEQLARLVGHPIDFDIDTSVLPEYEAEFSDALIETIEQMAVAIAGVRDGCHPLLFSDLMAVLHTVEVRYDASLQLRRGYDSELDLSAKTLRVTISGVHRVFVPRGLVREELYRAQRKVAAKRYAGRKPADVAADEYAYYVYYLQTLGDSVEALELAGRLHDRLPRGELKDEVAELVAETGTRIFFADGAPRGPDTARVRARWVAWMERNLWALSDHDRDTWLDAVYDPKTTSVPEIDPMRLGFAVVDRWVKAGRPGPDKRRSPGPTFDQIVCPVDLADEDHRANYCRSGFYTHAWSDPRRREAFIAQLVKRKDPALVRAVTGWLRARGTTEDLLTLWDGVASSDVAWRAVGHELALVGLHGELDDHLHRMWRSWPERRGTILFIVAMEAHHMMEYYRAAYWKRFEADFGTVDASTFGSFLSHGPRALATAWIVWPVVQRFNRGEAFARHLDELLDDEHLASHGFEHPVDALEHTIERMCETPRRSDELRSMVAALDARTRDNPEERTDLARARRLTRC